MPKRVPTIAITVIRDGKRITPAPHGKAFDFTADEIKSVTAQHPAAFRKPINEEADNDAEGATGATAPEKTIKGTANKANGKKKTVKAAEADSTSDEALDTENDETETEGDEAGEDDDI